MTYRRNDHPWAAFGRPKPSQQGEVPGLGLIFLALLIGGLFAVHQVIGLATGGPATSKARDLGRMLGYGEPERVRVGYTGPTDPAQAAEPAASGPAQPAVDVAGVQIAPPPAAQPTAAATATPKAEQFRVANTDGLGVVLHTAPDRSARVPRGLMEGARVTVLQRRGSEWALVRAENGQEGWVGAAYLAPTD
jgi:hypothetical protein